jgi:hypothetical protein
MPFPLQEQQGTLPLFRVNRCRKEKVEGKEAATTRGSNSKMVLTLKSYPVLGASS